MKSEYNHYPDTNHVKGNPQVIFSNKGYTHTFSTLKDGEILADSKKKKEFINNILFATSGQLVCKNQKAFTSTHNFRMLMNFHENDSNKKIAFTDSNFSVVAQIVRNHVTQPIVEWTGIHLFGRYQSENNLYVVSFRLDGTIVMKKKIKGEYTTLYR